MACSAILFLVLKRELKAMQRMYHVSSTPNDHDDDGGGNVDDDDNVLVMLHLTLKYFPQTAFS